MLQRAPPASVLVIDDDADFRSVVREELSHAGYDVSEAAGGAEGIERLRNEDVDVLVLDLQMPGKNGREVLREARDMGVKSEVVVTTAFPQLDLAVECLRAGVFDLLEKPFSPKALLGTLSHAVERGRLTRTTALYQATREIFAAHDPEHLPQVIVDTVVRALDADDASLMVPDGAGALTIACSNGLPATMHASVRVRIGEGIAGRVAQDRIPALLVGAARSNPRFTAARSDERVRSSIVYPLASGDRLVGVLNVNRTEKRKAFREADLDLAGVFASQALLALENVGLLRRVMRTERLAFLGRLAADLSHEVANPTSFIIANLEFLRENLPGEGPLGLDLVSSAEEALQGARRIAKVVQDIRAVVRGEEPAHVRVDLNEAVRFALRMSAHQLEGIAVESALDGDGMPVLGDEARLGQVFLNLLVNAGHALAGRPDARVRVLTERDGAQVRAIVSDNGPGIPRRDQGRIFDAFFTTKPSGAGSGLGLSISREIVRRHGGEIVVESEEGRGSRFIVTLPAAPEPH